MKDREITVDDVLNLFRNHCREGRVPLYLSGDIFVDHFGLVKDDKNGLSIDKFFNRFCYELEVLTINPGTDEASYHWEQNDFGLKDSYFTQLQRELKINDLGI